MELLRKGAYLLFVVLVALVICNLNYEKTKRRMVGLFLNDKKAFDGYTLFSSGMNSTVTYLINNAGEVVHEWETPHGSPGARRLLENGNLLYTGWVDVREDPFPLPMAKPARAKVTSSDR